MKWLDFIVSPRGQWDHPGKPTAVPTDNGIITMEGVPYPLFAMDETGYGGMIYPGGNYQFRGNMVYEIPMAQYGKQVKKSIVSAEELPEDVFPYEGTSAMFRDERYNIDRAKKLYTEDEFGHLPSIDYETGEWLKAKRYPTSWKEFLQYALNPEVNKLGFPTENKEGFLKYPNYANGGDISIPDLSRPNWLDKAQNGLQYTGEPTRADSLELLKNARLVQDYYKSKDYENDETFYFSDDFIKKEALGSTEEMRRLYSPNSPRKTPSGTALVPLDQYYMPVDKNKFYQREYASQILDTRTPMQLYDRRILPTAKYSYRNIKPGDRLQGDNVGIYGYDPISITPWDMLTDKQKKLRVKRFGRNSVPEDYDPDRSSVPKNLPYKNVQLLQQPEDRLIREYNTIVPNENYRRVYDQSPYSLKEYGPEGKPTHWAKADEKIPGVWRPMKETPSDLFVNKKVKFSNGGSLDMYQDGSQVAPNLPGYNPEVGPTIKNAELLKQLEMQEAVRNSQSLNLPSSAIQSTLGPVEYAMLPGLAAPVIKAAMAPKAPADPELEAIRKILRKNVTHIKQTRPLTETPPWPNRFLELGDDAWVIGNMERGRASKPNPDVDLPGRLPKPTPKQLPGVNGTQYPNRLPKQKYGGWLDEYPDGGTTKDRLKKRLLNKYPGMQSIYGAEGENLNIIKDRGFMPAEYGYGNIEFINPGTGLVSYTDDYQYQSPTPDKYTIVYNPRGANRKDIALDMLHGMRDDQNYMNLLAPFEKAVRDTRGGDMEYFYNEDVKKGFAEDGQDTWDKNYMDGLLRAEFAGYMAKGRKDYKTERQAASPEMIARAKDIYNYVRGDYEKGGPIATDNQDYNYIKYKDLSLSRGTGWLDNYK